jgi:hypothetical protein
MTDTTQLPAPPPAPLPSTRPSRPVLTAVLAITGCALIMGTISGIDELAGNIAAEEAASQDDASVSTCSIDARTGDLLAGVEVINHSSETSTYVIEIAFETPSGRFLDRGDLMLAEVAPGETVVVDALGEAPAGSDVECRIEHVERFSA